MHTLIPLKKTKKTKQKKKKHAKFQNDQYQTVRGVALTRGIHCLYIEGVK